MAIVKAKPKSPGRRGLVRVRHDHLWKGKPHQSLTEAKKSTGGRNNNGRITTRHQGGGHKQRYRVIDFKRDKDGVPATVATVEYDPNRSAHIALVKYADGERRYILAPKGLRAGAGIVSGEDAPIKPAESPYGNTKQVGEEIIRDGARAHETARTGLIADAAGIGREAGRHLRREAGDAFFAAW